MAKTSNSFVESQSIVQFLLYTLVGVLGLSILAQIKLVIPLSPVPVTGQTFGVAIIALSCSPAVASAILLSYLSFGAMGAPVFAGGISGLAWGPTLGYLIGMCVSVNVVSRVREKFQARSFKSLLALSYLNSIIVFSFGLLVLAQFTGWNQVLLLGLFPFLLGDLIKNFLASGIAYSIQRSK
ncbi:MAG: biotin transporter BioY [Bdellovibrionales bacterium]